MSEATPWFRSELGLRIAGYGTPDGPTYMAGAEGDTLLDEPAGARTGGRAGEWFGPQFTGRPVRPLLDALAGAAG